MAHQKKALYIHFEQTDSPTKKGILNKLEGKFKAFNNRGYDIDVISFKTKRILQFNSKNILKIPSRNFFFRFFVYSSILKVIKRNSYKFVYFRYPGSDRYFLKFLKKVNQLGLKLFLEFPTFPYDKERNPKNAFERQIIKLDIKYRALLYKYVYHAVTYTSDDNILNIPTIKLQNGIDIEKYSQLKLPVIQQKELNLIAVANLSNWHGYDRLIKGMQEYYNQNIPLQKVSLKIVGKGTSYAELKNLVHDLKLEKYIQFVGIKSGKELNEEFNSINLAIGSLGMHRIGLNTGSILKLREYTARGLPTVIGYTDVSIERNNPFVFQVEANDSPININSLISFMANLKVTSEEIRAFAKQNFSWEKQIDKILSYL